MLTSVLGALKLEFARTSRLFSVGAIIELVSRQVRPLERAMSRFLRAAAGLPAGADVVRNIR